MRPIHLLLCCGLCALPVAAGNVTAGAAAAEATGGAGHAAGAVPGSGPFRAGEARLADFRWKNRLVVVFADTPEDPSYVRQIDLLAARLGPLAERGVVILTDTDPGARSPVRIALRPRGFALVIVDKDGQVLQRKPSPWDVREITRAIDKTPLRQQELRDARESGMTGDAPGH